MKIKFDSTVLIVREFDIMKDFYLNILQQEVEHDFGNCISLKCGITIWQLKEEYPIVKKLGSTHRKEGNQNLEMCFTTERIDEVSQRLSQIKIRYLHRMEEETWGQKTIRFFDPENNLIQVGESIPAFVKRLFNSGMSIEEVASKTGVESGKVKDIVQNK